MALVNYYEVLDVAQHADTTTITDAIKQQRTTWRKRATLPKAETRAAAEQMTARLAEAEQVLLDAARRTAYDRQLAAETEAARASGHSTAGARDWVAIAAQHLQDGNASAANMAAREATTNTPDVPLAWAMRGTSSNHLGNTADAEFAFLEAIRLDPTSAALYSDLADVYSGTENWRQALAAFERAAALDPGDPSNAVGAAMSHAALDEYEEALPILKQAAEEHPEVDSFQHSYAAVLADYAASRWSKYPDGTSSILSQAQLDQGYQVLAVIDDLRISDPELIGHIQEFRAHVDESAKVRNHPSQHVRAYVFGYFVAIFVVLFGLGGGSGGLTTLGIVLMVLLIVVMVMRHRMANWKWRRKHSDKAVAATGLQDAR
ncbi:hypothetical protein GCM10017714_11030 [Curtobacterium pusillum]|uniref:J domain-containing protein n=1 Tax=Curtobacterium pusillum TaxID=69373 RepID=A0ABX2M6P4_9MICO|nr:tetratricopeptide repeat protein [Curtobacterium pusillum]NUU13755.1 hypothetical protein [Curtobacterium pusillum]GLK30363.1 hypothetical protein GCM10017610_06480 [Curtobacterium pusillum]